MEWANLEVLSVLLSFVLIPYSDSNMLFILEVVIRVMNIDCGTATGVEITANN